MQPKCPVFGKCGGCLYQDKEYDRQLAIKKNKIKEVFEYYKVNIPSEIKVYFKDEFYYRNRMDFVFSEGGLGQRRRGKFNRVVNFNECFIANADVNRLLSIINSYFFENKDKIKVFDIDKKEGCLRYAVIRSPYYSKNSTVTFILNKNSPDVDEHKILIRDFAKKNYADNIIIGYVKQNSDVSITPDYEVIKGNDVMLENLAGKKFYYHTQGFFQNNSPVTIDAVMFVREKIMNGAKIFDLFGGVGTFGIFSAEKASEVIVADNNKFNLDCAIKNSDINKISNLKTFELDARDFGKLSDELNGENDVFILDPPRAGLHKKTIKFLKEAKAKQIIYISCNPENLGRDLSQLKEIYAVNDFAVFDMFPQTGHVEIAAELKLIE